MPNGMPNGTKGCATCPIRDDINECKKTKCYAWYLKQTTIRFDIPANL
jgi:hypothetical protein